MTNTDEQLELELENLESEIPTTAEEARAIYLSFLHDLFDLGDDMSFETEAKEMQEAIARLQRYAQRS